MNDHVDEEIGALLDGRLDLRRRTELLARLATDDADYDVFADTAAVLREAEEDESAEKESLVDREVVRETEVPSLATDDVSHEVSAEIAVGARDATGNGSVETASTASREVPRETAVIPLRPRRLIGWRSPAVRTLAAAAVLAVVAVPVLRSRKNERAWRNTGRMAALASPAGASTPAEFDHQFNTTRGGSENVPNSGVAAQVGALHLDLEVAARSPGPIDTATVAQLAGTAVATLENAEQTGPNLAAQSYREITASTDWSRPAVLERLKAAKADVLQYVDPDYFALGAWTEAARLVARRQDAAFFRTRESRTALERAASLTALRRNGKAAATRLRTAQNQGGIRNWALVRDDLDELQHELSR